MKKVVEVTEIKKMTVDIEFPYYYYMDASYGYSMCDIYGFIQDEKSSVKVITIDSPETGAKEYKFSIEKRRYDEYYYPKHKSDKDTYDEAKRELLESASCL